MPVCPLLQGNNWNNRGEFPEVCIDTCQARWEEATKKQGGIDDIDPDCQHAVTYEDESLQRIDGSPNRQYSILYLCMRSGQEAFAEEWSFTCPND